MKNIMRIALTILFLFALSPAMAQNEDDATGPSGLPLPRFASLRSNEVNMRTGPGTRYPIEWVFSKEGLPVEITAEFDVWRRVRDAEGTRGWVHKSTLSGRRGLITNENTHNVYREEDETSPVMAHVESGAVGRLLSCKDVWCAVAFGDIEGYMKKEDFWGAYEHETFR